MGSRTFWNDGNPAWERAADQQWAKEQMAEDEYVNNDNKKTPVVTPAGLSLIKQWVEEKTWHDGGGPVHRTDPDNLNAWANEAEQAVLNGNSPTIEMHGMSTRSGVTETFTLPRYCIEWVDTD